MDENSTTSTLGESRVHLTFNPSADDKIGTFKKMIAEAIDYLDEIRIKDPTTFKSGEANRCISIAMTELETAQMYGVKAIAKLL